MDITSIGIALLPFLLKGGEKISELIGEELWSEIKKPFTKPKDVEIVTRLQNNPADVEAKALVNYKLQDLFDEHPDLRQALVAILQNIPESSQKQSITATGTGHVIIQDLGNSKVWVNQNTGPIK